MTTDRPTSELHPEISDSRKRELFEHGIELFNTGRYFEAHDPWEEIWRSTNPEPRDLFQGLVQITAGLHIWFERSSAKAASRVIRRGCEKLRAVSNDATATATPTQLDPDSFLRQVEEWIAWLEETDTAPPPPRPRLGTSRDQ